MSRYMHNGWWHSKKSLIGCSLHVDSHIVFQTPGRKSAHGLIERDFKPLICSALRAGCPNDKIVSIHKYTYIFINQWIVLNHQYIHRKANNLTQFSGEDQFAKS
ncbi:hypothetical protein NPIL_296421 [Nephila pilipes]|uniref:Uncharacterized protein n=1 Tax=Nephila pilipes TaxID=299642 RepID=A0A8X6TIQ3_NEPPI|nr:hypothetical protein NPIL_296421 [Nephila pilipes]